MSQGEGGGQPLKFKTVEDLDIKIQEYVDSCFDYIRDMWGNRVKDKESKGKDVVDENGKAIYLMKQVKPFTITGLAYFLDTTRDTLMDYESGEYDDKDKNAEENKKFSDTIRRCKLMIHAYAEEQLFIGKNPQGAMFNLKNNWKWEDKQVVENKDSFFKNGKLQVEVVDGNDGNTETG